jgi:hypothetical protein
MSHSRPHRSSALVYALLSLAWIGRAMPSAAQTLPARGPVLNWVRLAGAESCIASVELAKRVEQRLGRAVFVRANDAIIVIEGRVGPNRAGGFASVIRVSDADGTLYGVRELSVADADCHKLDEIVSLVMAITIRHQDGAASGIALPRQVAAQLDALFEDEPSTLDPSELSPQPSASSLPTDSTVAEHTTSPSRAGITQRATMPAAERASAFRVSVEVGLGLATGLQPAATVGPSLRLRASLAGLGSVALSGNFGLAQVQSFPTEANGTLSYQPVQLGVAVCPPAWQLWLSELTLCADLRVGRIGVRAAGFLQRNGRAYELWPEVAASASARTALLGPSYLHLRLGVPIRLVLPDFRYRDSQGGERSAFAMSRLGVELELGVGVVF